MRPSPGSVAGRIDEDQRWAGPIFVKGDLVVVRGATLTLAPEAVVRFSPVPLDIDSRTRRLRSGKRPVHDPHKPAILVEGTLRVQGSAGKPVRIGAGSAWAGIHVLENGKAEIEEAELEGSVGEALACWDRGRLSMVRSTIRRCGVGIGCYGSGSVSLEETSIERAEGASLVAERAKFRWRGGGWKDCGAGIDAWKSEARVDGLHGSGGRRGIRVEEGELEARGIELDSSSLEGLVARRSRVRLERSRFENVPVGLRVERSRLRLEGNRFRNHRKRALELLGVDGRAEANRIENFGTGIVAARSNLASDSNHFERGDVGIELRSRATLESSHDEIVDVRVGAFIDGGIGRFSRGIFSRSEQAFRVESGAVFGEGLEIKNQADAGIVLERKAKADLSGSILKDCASAIAANGAFVTLRDCRIEGALKHGLDLKGGATSLASVSVESREAAVDLQAGRLVARDLRVTPGSVGFVLRREGRVSWEGGGVSGGEVGFRLEEGNADLHGVSIEATRQGVRAERGHFSVSRLKCEGIRDVALSAGPGTWIEVDQAELRDVPVGFRAEGGASHFRKVRFLNCSSIACGIEGGRHRFEDCFFDPMHRSWEVSPRADFVLDGARLGPGGAMRRRGFLELLWAFVLATRTWPFFRWTYRQMYRFAVAEFRRYISRQDRVSAAGIGRGWVSGDWEPGVSDLDFIVVSEGLEGESGRRWLAAFWERFKQWRRRFPFWGEVLLASPKDLKAFREAGGARARELSGLTEAFKGSFGSPASTERDGIDALQAFQECATAYTRLLQWGYSTRNFPGDFRRRQVEKAVLDILRYGGPGRGRSTRREFLAGAVSSEERGLFEKRLGSRKGFPELHFEALAFLHHRAEGFLGESRMSFFAAKGPVLRGDPPSEKGSEVKHALERSRLETLKRTFGEDLRGVLFSDLYRDFIVLADSWVSSDRGCSSLRRWLQVRDERRDASPPPIVLSERLWKLWLRVPFLENPLAFLDWSGAGPLGSGRDAGGPFRGSSQWVWAEGLEAVVPEDGLVFRAAREAAANLKWTWRWMGAPDSGFSAPRMLHHLWTRALGLRLILERNRAVSFLDWEALSREARTYFPETADALAGIEASCWERSPQALFLEQYPSLEKAISSIPSESRIIDLSSRP